MALNPIKLLIMMCLGAIMYQKVEIITESTSPDRRLSGLSPQTVAHQVTWQFTQVSTLHRRKKNFL